MHETDPRRRPDEGASALDAVAALPRAVAWTALWANRKLQQQLRRTGLPLPRLPAFRRRHPAGTPPGTLASHPDAAPPRIHVIGYGAEEIAELEVTSVAQLAELRQRWPVLWVDVVGVGHAESIAAFGDVFGIHRLALEDVMNVHQRPKVDEYEQHLYVVARTAQLGDRVDTEQLSMFVGDGWVLTFQERPGDPWEPVRERIRHGRGRLRSRAADYLFYALLDAVIDHFYPVLEEYGTRIELLEEEVIAAPRKELVGVIHAARRDLIELRHAMWPMRDAMNQVYRDPSPLVAPETRVYLRDAYDHTVQIIDLLENYREMASALMEVYLSSVSQRMNEVMKILTIIATIFIPLTFVVGVYGMNFDPEASPWNMPELGWYWGYPAVMVFMTAIALGLLGYFKWRRWF